MPDQPPTGDPANLPPPGGSDPRPWPPPGGTSDPRPWPPPGGASQPSGAPGGPGGPVYPGGRYVGPRPTAEGAVGSLVCGILGLVLCGLLGIPAIIMGNKARRNIKWSGDRLGGDGMALAGVILGWIAVVSMIIGVVVVVILLASTDWNDLENTLNALGT